MNAIIQRACICLYVLLFTSVTCYAEESWREEMDSLNYAPKYFGPNAFPIPKLNSGKIKTTYELEANYNYHHADGDNTRNFSVRAYIPFGKKAAIEMDWIIQEYYSTSQKIKEERHAANTRSDGLNCHGDIVLSSMFQILENDEWFDALLSLGLKTASGNQLVDARYTDAASYWINVNAGRDVYTSKEDQESLRLLLMGGFYCYMTNVPKNRQNDAWMAGAGFQYQYKDLDVNGSLRGFRGYWGNGDQPVLAHLELKYKLIEKHSVYCSLQQGLNDYLYTSISAGYIFSF